MIRLEGIKKIYPGGVTALDTIDLDISKQNIVGIIGANGSGKSTLLKIMAGFLKPDKGKITIFGHSPLYNNNMLRKKISYISQYKSLDPEMTGRETLNYFAALHGFSRKQSIPRIQALIHEFSMTKFISRKIQSYSGGQKQRLHLAIGFIGDPEILLLDEPGSALDPDGKRFIWNHFQKYKSQECTIIVIEHELTKISRFCSQLIILDKGRMVANDSPESIISQHSRPLLKITTQKALNCYPDLKKQLQQLWSAVRCKINDKQISLEFDDISFHHQPGILLKLLQLMAEHQIIVTKSQWQEPGLDQAFFQLTGKTANALTAGHSSHHGKGSKQYKGH